MLDKAMQSHDLTLSQEIVHLLDVWMFACNKMGAAIAFRTTETHSDQFAGNLSCIGRTRIEWLWAEMCLLHTAALPKGRRKD